jgi:hypothetical protein
MDFPKQIEVLTNHECFAPEGEVTPADVVALVSQAIQFCRQKKIPRLLADVSGLTGFLPPLTHERYWAVREWAGEAAGALVLAVVAREEMIDPQRFGVLVARNAGLRSFVSSSECEARSWLLAQDVF